MRHVNLAEVCELELSLLDPAVRADRAAIERLLDEDFVEFGASGTLWTRVAMTDALAADPRLDGECVNLDAQQIADDVVLVTYRIIGERESLRSSLWVRNESGTWHLRFHQGTDVTH
jgi:hypothetical protein